MNKVNTKAELQLVPSATTWIPKEIRGHLKAVMIFKSDQYRSQPENQAACLRLLRRELERAVRETVPAPVPEAQVKRVEALKRISNEQRLQLKRRLSDKKSSRRPPSDF